MKSRLLHPLAPLLLLTPTLPTAGAQQLVVWANDGGDKVTAEELRAAGSPAAVHNSVWDGSTVRLFGARNESLSFNLVLEAPGAALSGVSVEFDTLRSRHVPDFEITNTAAPGQSLFDWRGRDIELFYVRYLQIHGLGQLHYEDYDERHVPERMRRPFTGPGYGSGLWTDRPDHDKHYPDIAVPLELHPTFDITAGQNQSIWVDVYVPPGSPADFYDGTLTVRANGLAPLVLPVELEVLDFDLPDEPTAKTMAYLGFSDPNVRYLGIAYPDCGSAAEAEAIAIRDRHFQLAHRHRVSLITDENSCDLWLQDRPLPAWEPRLDGSLFTPARGYAGPGIGVGNGVYSIGTYGSWWWKADGEAGMRTHSDGWTNWFQANAPDTEHFLYLIDESSDTAQMQQWAEWIENNPGPGSALLSMATLPLPLAHASVPALDVPTSSQAVGITADWEAALAALRTDPSKRFYYYNGVRPAAGSLATEDDGVALRTWGWCQHKFDIDRWFVWETTYYDNFQGGTGQTDVMNQAFTYGGLSGVDPVYGETGWNYSNGDGVLFYPGTDTLFPASSYGIPGPIASLRLKHWRRGLQDHDYLELAAAVDPAATAAVVDGAVPTVLWEIGIDEPLDPTYKHTDISWSTDPDDWEARRRALADLIVGAPRPAAIASVPGCGPTPATLASLSAQVASGQPVDLALEPSLPGAGVALLYGGYSGLDANGCGLPLGPSGEVFLALAPSLTLLDDAPTAGAPLALQFTTPSVAALVGKPVLLQALNAVPPPGGGLLVEFSNGLGAIVQ